MALNRANPVSSIRYHPPFHNRQTVHTKSIIPIGIDTEAYEDGVCFMISTSRGDVWSPADWPQCLFSREYRGTSFVAWNLKYDMGAFIQHLPIEALKELQENDRVEHDGFKYHVLGNKYIAIRRGKNSIRVYDLMGFYNTSLDAAAKTHLGEGKIEMETKTFSRKYVMKHRDEIARYCIQDSVLAERLADVIIKRFEKFRVYPQKLYSTAHVSWTYFRNRCPYVHVKKYYDKHRDVLNAALWAYNGGKFEVTTKGPGSYYSYDIVSAYPYEIANLVDIRFARVCRQRKYRKNAAYGFVDVSVKIPFELPSPVAIKKGSVCCYPVGEIRKWITKTEYEYFAANGCDVTIHNAVWLVVDKRVYPYRREIKRLMKWKDEFKRQNSVLDYHTIKIFLNSFYGKLAQLIDKNGRVEAGSAWNPIYASVITANCRTRISELQRIHPSVVAVHTDSIISTEKLCYSDTGVLGDLTADKSGQGLILGSGIYQIGSKTAFRGLHTRKNLNDLLPTRGKHYYSTSTQPITWRQVACWNRDPSLINRFIEQEKKVAVDFDAKRIWLDDYKDFSEVRERNVMSGPLISTGTNDIEFNNILEI